MMLSVSTTSRRIAAALAAVLAAMLTGAGTQARARTLHTVLEDDSSSLFAPSQLSQYMRTLRWLGVDELRISAEWKLEAPEPDSATPPSGAFRATDPSSYQTNGMQLLDNAVRAAAANRIKVIVDPAFSAPRWATTDTASHQTYGDPWYRTNVDVQQTAAWEQMLALRYSGRYTPPGQSAPLPRVDTFTLWNEPNESGYLQPQWNHGIAVSADWYRALVSQAYPAIKRVSPHATVLIGNTSDAGADAQAGKGGVPPLAFIRRLACVDAQLRPISDGSCARFRTVPADGYAHHPYERGAPPWVGSDPTQRDWAQMGDLPKLQSLLDQLVAMRRLAPGAQNLWLTEQGYESNAELPDRPWTEAQQAQLNADSEYLAWRDGQVVSFSQFLLRDTRTAETLTMRRLTDNARRQLFGTWTSGLVRENSVPKPAMWMFRSPIVARVISAGRVPATITGLGAILLNAPTELLEVWGRARPATSPSPVQITVYDGNLQLTQSTTTDSNGIFDVHTSVPIPSSGATSVHFGWPASDGTWQTSPITQPAVFPAP
jgi:hypothetical protein